MIVGSQNDIDNLTRIGKIVAMTIDEMKKQTRVGMTTLELDLIGKNVLERFGASSAPKNLYNFPGYTCISVNHEVAHGIPSNRVIREGDLINIDVSAELNGYYADAGHSFLIPPFNRKLSLLCEETYHTMMKVINSLKAGVKLNTVGKIIQDEAKKTGFKVINNLCSHGIGRSLHEEPREILPYYDPKDKTVLAYGQVITIEPFLSTGADYVLEHTDGWTLKVPDKSYVAQYEHTIIITNDKPIITTLI